MEARGRGGREGEEREKGKRLGGPRLRSHTERPNRLLSTPTTETAGQWGPRPSPHPVEAQRVGSTPGCHGQVAWQKRGWRCGERASGESLFVFRPLAALPLETGSNLGSLQAQRQSRGRAMSHRGGGGRRQLARPRQGHRTAAPPHADGSTKPRRLPALSGGQGDAGDGQTGGGRLCSPRRRIMNLGEDTPFDLEAKLCRRSYPISSLRSSRKSVEDYRARGQACRPGQALRSPQKGPRLHSSSPSLGNIVPFYKQ